MTLPLITAQQLQPAGWLQVARTILQQWQGSVNRVRDVTRTLLETFGGCPWARSFWKAELEQRTNALGAEVPCPPALVSALVEEAWLGLQQTFTALVAEWTAKGNDAGCASGEVIAQQSFERLQMHMQLLQKHMRLLQSAPTSTEHCTAPRIELLLQLAQELHKQAAVRFHAAGDEGLAQGWLACAGLVCAGLYTMHLVWAACRRGHPCLRWLVGEGIAPIVCHLCTY